MGHPHENNIPDGAPNINDNEREVFIAYRPVGGPISSWTFTVLGSLINIPPKIGRTYAPPNPTSHWCVTVGNWLHQLQATSLNGGENYYNNAEMHEIRDNWAMFKVGSTSFNDVAIKNSGQ
jgi:hypothetical protein